MNTTTQAFYQVLASRRSVRNFDTRVVEADKLERVLAAGMKAPSHNHMREWHFLVLEDPAVRQSILDLGDAFSRTPDRKFLDATLSHIADPLQREVYSYSIPLQEKMLVEAPTLIAVCFRMTKPIRECESLFDLNCVASIWLVIQNILLAMAAEGLYGVTMVPFRTSALKRLLLVPPDMEIAAFIPIGYPAHEPPIRQVPVNIHQRIHLNKW